MSKRSPFGNMNMPGLGDLMKQAKKMQEDQVKLQEELAEMKMEATSGGGMVTAYVNGKGELLDIKIDPQCVDPDDVEMLQDLVVSAVREALEKVESIKVEKLQELTGGINIPGLF